jgi:hypothetical protein
MGGSISVDTAPGRGACFTVCVPVVLLAAPDATVAPPPRQQQVGEKRLRSDASAAGLRAAAPPALPAAMPEPATQPTPQHRCRVLLVGASWVPAAQAVTHVLTRCTPAKRKTTIT